MPCDGAPTVNESVIDKLSVSAVDTSELVRVNVGTSVAMFNLCF